MERRRRSPDLSFSRWMSGRRTDRGEHHADERDDHPDQRDQVADEPDRVGRAPVASPDDQVVAEVDRKAVEPLVLESALESSRVVADVLHTLGYLAQRPIDRPEAEPRRSPLDGARRWGPAAWALSP